MKITGLDTWGSDILFVKSAFAKNILKPLLLLGCKTPSDARLPDKTLITSASLHHHEEKIKQQYLVIHARRITKKISQLFHIVEQKFSVFTPV